MARPLLDNIVKRTGSVIGFRAGRMEMSALTVTTGAAGKFKGSSWFQKLEATE